MTDPDKMLVARTEEAARLYGHALGLDPKEWLFKDLWHGRRGWRLTRVVVIAINLDQTEREQIASLGLALPPGQQPYIISPMSPNILYAKNNP